MKTRFQLFRIPLLCCFALTLVISGGCDKEKMDEMVAKAKETSSDAFNKAKEATSDAVSKVKEQTSDAVDQARQTASRATTSAGNLVSMNGKASIKVESQTEFPASFIRVVPLGDGTNIIQMKSYKDDQSDTFPAFFMQGVVDASNVDALNGKSVPCKFYAQKSDGKDVWVNQEGQPIVVEFKKTDKTISATFTNATLINTTSGSQSSSSGILDCVPMN